MRSRPKSKNSQPTSNQPDAFMHLLEDASWDDKDDDDTKECKSLFKNTIFFLGHEVGSFFE